MLKKKTNMSIATKPRKKHMAFMPDPNEDDEKTINLNCVEAFNYSFSQKQPQGKTKIIPMQTDQVPNE